MSLTKEVDEFFVRYELKQQCLDREAMLDFARRHKLTIDDIEDVSRGLRSPTASILRALGYKRIERVTYVKTSP